MAKNTCFLMALLAGFAVLIGCAEEGAGSVPGTEDNVMGLTDEPSPPQKPGTYPGLDAETELRIKLDFLVFMGVDIHKNPDKVDYLRLDYFGTYNGCVALMMSGGGLMFAQATTGYGIAGLHFGYSSSQQIEIWKPDDHGEAGHFYKLNAAYDLGFLTEDDIRSIHKSYYTYRQNQLYIHDQALQESGY